MTSRKERIRIRHTRIRNRVFGTRLRPRLAVHFSGRHIYVQIVDDEAHLTLVAVSTTEAMLRSDAKSNVATATKVGGVIAERAMGLSIRSVVFDRGGFKYHGKVKALADALRRGGLDF